MNEPARSLLFDPRRRLALLLRLIALHAIVTGVALLVVPPDALVFFGYHGYQGRFFPAQGGALHVALSLVYLYAAARLERAPELIVITIAAKAIALGFLLAYSLLVEPIWIVALSGVADGMMGVTVYLCFRNIRPS